MRPRHDFTPIDAASRCAMILAGARTSRPGGWGTDVTIRTAAAACAAALWILASPIGAHAQVPTLSTGWADFKDQLDACRDKAEAMLRELKLRRIERGRQGKRLCRIS
jgi:hypothetical protein